MAVYLSCFLPILFYDIQIFLLNLYYNQYTNHNLSDFAIRMYSTYK